MARRVPRERRTRNGEPYGIARHASDPELHHETSARHVGRSAGLGRPIRLRKRRRHVAVVLPGLLDEALVFVAH
jgi:hypothetical protein